MTVRLFAITDLSLASADETLRRARAVLAAVGDPRTVAFGVRDHDQSTRVRLALARALCALARPVGARVFVHDRIDLALVAEADGVHLAERSVDASDARSLLAGHAGSYVGRSCHDARGIADAGEVDAITLSPLFASPGKGAPLGARRFAELARAARCPVIALGGIDAANAREALAVAQGVAVIRAWLLDAPELIARAVG